MFPPVRNDLSEGFGEPRSDECAGRLEIVNVEYARQYGQRSHDRDKRELTFSASDPVPQKIQKRDHERKPDIHFYVPRIFSEIENIADNGADGLGLAVHENAVHDYDNGGYDVGQKYRNKTRVIFQKRLRRNFDLLFRAEIAGKEQEQRNAGHEHNADERHQVHAFADDRLIVVFDFEKKMYARDLNESDNSREIKSDVALRTGNRHFSSPPRLYVIEGGIAGVFCARQYDLNFRCVSAHHRPRIFRRSRRRCRRCFVFCRLHRHIFRPRFCSAGTTSSAA